VRWLGDWIGGRKLKTSRCLGKIVINAVEEEKRCAIQGVVSKRLFSSGGEGETGMVVVDEVGFLCCDVGLLCLRVSVFG